MDKFIEEAQHPERFLKSEKIDRGSDGWLSPKGDYYQCDSSQHDESATYLVGNSTEVKEEEKRRFRHSFMSEDYDAKVAREKLKEQGWILINGPVFRTDNTLNYTTNQLSKLVEAGIPIVGTYDGSKEFSSKETLGWIKTAVKDISDFLESQKLLGWRGNMINQNEFWKDIKDRGYSTLEDFKKDPFHTTFGDFVRVGFTNVRDVLTKGYQDEAVFDYGQETYTLRLIGLDSGERVCIEYTFHHHDRDSGNEEHMNAYVVDNFTFKDKIKKYLSTGINPQIKGDYFRKLIESK